jgi:P-type Cu+ transporter
MRMSTVVGESRAEAACATTRSADLAVGGMSCASCAARIEKKLNKLDGVTATVNSATETAQVTFPATLGTGDLIYVVEQAGYTAALPALRGHESARAASEEDGTGKADTLRRRLLVSLALAIRSWCWR